VTILGWLHQFAKSPMRAGCRLTHSSRLVGSDRLCRPTRPPYAELPKSLVLSNFTGGWPEFTHNPVLREVSFDGNSYFVGFGAQAVGANLLSVTWSPMFLAEQR
jgi:hypothetical protein